MLEKQLETKRQELIQSRPEYFNKQSHQQWLEHPITKLFHYDCEATILDAINNINAYTPDDAIISAVSLKAYIDFKNEILAWVCYDPLENSNEN